MLLSASTLKRRRYRMVCGTQGKSRVHPRVSYVDIDLAGGRSDAAACWWEYPYPMAEISAWMLHLQRLYDDSTGLDPAWKNSWIDSIGSRCCGLKGVRLIEPHNIYSD